MKPTWCTIYSQCISSILFITYTCFGPLRLHHQEGQLYLCDTRYLLFFIADCLSVMQDGMHTRQSAVCYAGRNAYQTVSCLLCRTECIPDSQLSVMQDGMQTRQSAVCYAGRNAYQTVSCLLCRTECIPDSQLYRITSSKCVA